MPFYTQLLGIFSKGELLAEHHILEDLLGMYRAEGETGTVLSRSGRDIETYHQQEHDVPLRTFFKAEINRVKSIYEPVKLGEHKQKLQYSGLYEGIKRCASPTLNIW